MRKYLIGMIVGIALTISATTYADDITSLIGKTVQGVFPVKVNGDILAKTAIVIDGTSYLPVRAIGDAIGYDVSFNADLGIELKQKEIPTMSIESLTPAVTDEVYDLKQIEAYINRFNGFINMMQMTIASAPDNEKVPEWQTELNGYQDELAIWEARKAALQPTP